MQGTRTRQRVRKAVLLVSFIAYPVTFFVLSPDLLFFGAADRVLAGDVVFFAGLFLMSLVFGRLFCGWVCPAGALQEMCFAINDRPADRRLDRVKWIVFIPWILFFAFLAVACGGITRVDFLYAKAFGIPLAGAVEQAMYFGTVGIVFVLAVFGGRRGHCHILCWISPFMIAGAFLREKARLPGLVLRVDRASCTACGACARACPMSLDLRALVETGEIREAECILCASCADACPKSAIHLGFSARVKGTPATK